MSSKQKRKRHPNPITSEFHAAWQNAVETLELWKLRQASREQLQSAIEAVRSFGTKWFPPRRLIPERFPTGTLSYLLECLEKEIEKIEKRRARAERDRQNRKPSRKARMPVQWMSSREIEIKKLEKLLEPGSRLGLHPTGCASGQTRKPDSHRAGRHS